MLVFERAGRKNTGQTIEAAVRHAVEQGISELVVASTYGDTAMRTARYLSEGRVGNIRLIVVTHNVGFRADEGLEMSSETRAELESMGAAVHTGTMPFRSIGTSIRATLGYSQQDLVANTLRLMGQGVKVCVEIALMAYDAGLLSGGDVVTVAGTGRGADTACVISPVPSNRLFDMKIRRIIAKPSDW